MELQAISQVSKKYGISVRTLRYYEQIGLIDSIRNNDNTYRFYDEIALKRLHQIIILRKLQIPMKQIRDILNNQSALDVIEIFKQNISELDEEITSLSTIKSILARFVEELRTKAGMTLQFDLLIDTTTLSVIDSLSFSKNYINNIKENVSMEELNKASENLNKLNERNVCIVNMPPMRTAAYSCVSVEPERKSIEVVKKWVADNQLESTARLFGFNTKPYAPTNDNPGYGFGFCVTVPQSAEITEPMYEKKLPGGLYAVVSDYDFDPMQTWNRVMALFKESDWEWAWDTDRHPEHPGLEEHIDRADGKDGFYLHIHVPVKKKDKKED